MSFALTLSDLNKKERRKYLQDFTVKIEPTQYNPNSQYFRCFLADSKSDMLFLPIGNWIDIVDEDFGFPNGNSFKKMSKKAKFVKELLTPETDPSGRERNQVEVVNLAIKRLKERGSVFLECYTGIGKTAMAIFLSIFFGYKTLIVCHLDSVRKQWVEAYEKFSGTTVKIQFISGKNCVLDPFADVYIVGVKKASHMHMDDFSEIGTVIVDEIHLSSVTIFTDVLLKIRPRILIGASATPDKCVGTYKFLNLYFGNEKEFIIRREVKNFTVYKFQTTFKPEVSYTMVQGKSVPNWNKIIESIEENSERWKIIANIAIENPNEKIAILCNRNCLAIGIYNIL